MSDKNKFLSEEKTYKSLPEVEGLKVLLLGAGAVGSVTATHLVMSPEISELVLGDIVPSNVQELNKRLASDKVCIRNVNVGDYNELMASLDGIDIVVNATLPKYNLTIMHAALKNEVNYIDVGTHEKVSDQLKFSHFWETAGLTAITGLGEDPGLSNIFARHVADKLDVIDEILIRDGDTAISKKHKLVSLFSPEVFLKEIFDKPLIYENRVFHRVRPLSGEEKYNFPDPIGQHVVYYADHEETETLPLFINKGLRRVNFKLTLDSETLQTLMVIERLGLTSEVPLDIKGIKVAPNDVLLALIPRPKDLNRKVNGYACITVEVSGKKDRENMRYRIYTFMDHSEAYKKYGAATATAYLTGTTLALGAIMLAEKEIKLKGVISPERIEPHLFMTKLPEKGINVIEEIMT